MPSKIKEGIFWAAIFRLISTISFDYDSDSIDQTNEATPVTLTDKVSESATTQKNLVISTSLNEPSSGSRSMNAKLDKAEARINELELALETAYKILRETKGVSLEPKGNAHKGRWIVDKDCREFLALDEEVKTRLREGKNKRVQEIFNELKFILNSDDEREARGRWDCCGKNEYLCVGCSS